MGLKDQLKKHFPDHEPRKESAENKNAENGLWIQEDPLICKYEKRKGKPITIIENYQGNKQDFKELTKLIQKELGVGGSSKGQSILLQGDFRDQVMKILQELGFKTKRVGG